MNVSNLTDDELRKLAAKVRGEQHKREMRRQSALVNRGWHMKNRPGEVDGPWNYAKGRA